MKKLLPHGRNTGLRFAALLFLLPNLAFAQQQPVDPQRHALALQMLAETGIDNNILRVQVEQLRQQLQMVQTELAKLKSDKKP